MLASARVGGVWFTLLVKCLVGERAGVWCWGAGVYLPARAAPPRGPLRVCMSIIRCCNRRTRHTPCCTTRISRCLSLLEPRCVPERCGWRAPACAALAPAPPPTMSATLSCAPCGTSPRSWSILCPHTDVSLRQDLLDTSARHMQALLSVVRAHAPPDHSEFSMIASAVFAGH